MSLGHRIFQPRCFVTSQLDGVTRCALVVTAAMAVRSSNAIVFLDRQLVDGLDRSALSHVWRYSRPQQRRIVPKSSRIRQNASAYARGVRS